MSKLKSHFECFVAFIHVLSQKWRVSRDAKFDLWTWTSICTEDLSPINWSSKLVWFCLCIAPSRDHIERAKTIKSTMIGRESFQVDGHICFCLFSVFLAFSFFSEFLLPLKKLVCGFVCTVLFKQLVFFFCFFFLSVFFDRFIRFSVPQSYVYGSPYLGATTTAGTGLVPIQATQLSHAAAIAAATNQFYEYQVSF